MKFEKICCDRCGKEVHKRGLFNTRGRLLKTVLSQTYSIPDSIFFQDVSNRTIDLCYECNIELREFLGIGGRKYIPHVNYRPCNDKVFYLCDRTACDKCYDECKHTSDIRHAVNFYQPHVNDDESTFGEKEDKLAYFEIEMVDGKRKDKENEEV